MTEAEFKELIAKAIKEQAKRIDKLERQVEILRTDIKVLKEGGNL